MSLKRRLERLEGTQSVHFASIMEVLCDLADPDDLDEADRAKLEELAFELSDERPIHAAVEAGIPCPDLDMNQATPLLQPKENKDDR